MSERTRLKPHLLISLFMLTPWHCACGANLAIRHDCGVSPCPL